MAERQQLLYLWLLNSAPDSNIAGLAFYDGTDGQGPQLPDKGDDPPYANGVEAIQDGWMLMQSPPPVAPTPDQLHNNAYLEYEFVFERRVQVHVTFADDTS